MHPSPCLTLLLTWEFNVVPLCKRTLYRDANQYLERQWHPTPVLLSFVQGEYRDTFTIDTDPSHNEGIIKPIKVGRPAAVASDGGLGAPGMLRTHPGAAPGSEATKGPCLGQVEQAVCSWIL